MPRRALTPAMPLEAQAPRLFTRPLPVAMALVLLLNDHLLKGSGLLPGWLTGKLSDFAGLFFAPLLIAELVLWFAPRTAPRNGVLAGSCAGVALLFTAIKLSTFASLRYVQLVSLLWDNAANVVDPTDLLALPMAALAWRYGSRLTAEAASRPEAAAR